MSSYRILFIDDDPLLSNSLARELNKAGFTTTVASSGTEGLQIAAEGPFHIMIVDLKLPDMGGMDLIRKTKKLYWNTSYIVLTGYADKNTALQRLIREHSQDKKNHAELLLTNAKTQIIPLIEKLARTKMTSEQQDYVESIKERFNTIVDSFTFKLSSRFLELTPSEIRITEWIRKGLTSKEIAENANLSVRTIEVHRENIRKKLGIKNKKINLRSYLLAMMEEP